MGRKAVGPVCCVMHVKEHRTLIVKEKGACPGVSGFAPSAPSSRVDMCAPQIFCIIIIIMYMYMYNNMHMDVCMCAGIWIAKRGNIMRPNCSNAP